MKNIFGMHFPKLLCLSVLLMLSMVLIGGSTKFSTPVAGSATADIGGTGSPKPTLPAANHQNADTDESLSAPIGGVKPPRSESRAAMNEAVVDKGPLVHLANLIMALENEFDQLIDIGGVKPPRSELPIAHRNNDIGDIGGTQAPPRPFTFHFLNSLDHEHSGAGAGTNA